MQGPCRDSLSSFEIDDRISRVQLLEDDQRAYDDWLTGETESPNDRAELDSISRMHWVSSADRVGLLTRNHASRNGKSLSWDELIVFTFVDGSRKKSIRHFSGDQYGVDA